MPTSPNDLFHEWRRWWCWMVENSWRKQRVRLEEATFLTNPCEYPELWKDAELNKDWGWWFRGRNLSGTKQAGGREMESEPGKRKSEIWAQGPEESLNKGYCLCVAFICYCLKDRWQEKVLLLILIVFSSSQWSHFSYKNPVR